MKKYDIIVIGAGGGAKIITPASKLGYKVAAIEKEAPGGTCLNRGCIPSKMIIHPADLATAIRDTDKFDFNVDKGFTVDFAKIITRISNTVDADSQKIVPAYEKNPNIDYYPHEAKFVSNKVLEVNGEQITGDKIFIAVGGRPQIPNISGLEGTPYWTSRETLRNTEQPNRLIVIGASYIGTELGHAYGALGTEVHFIVRSRLLRREDSDITDEFEKAFSKQYNVHLGFTPKEIKHEGGIFKVLCSNGDGEEKTIEAEALLIATGTIPNTDLLGIENTDIKLDEKGFVVVDDHLQTSVQDVYALGDCLGRYLFRHSVNFEGEYLMRALFDEKTGEPINYNPVPHAVFTHPQVAGVGKTETELKEEGANYVVGLNPYKSSAMGMARLPEHGFVKVLVDVPTRKILGAHIIGDEASNMIHLFILAMTTGATLDNLLDMIYIHPALPEIARNACRKAKASLLEKLKEQGASQEPGSLQW